jgi:hypothetical protein
MQEKIRAVVGFFEKMPSIFPPSARVAFGGVSSAGQIAEAAEVRGSGKAAARPHWTWFIVG